MRLRKPWCKEGSANTSSHGASRQKYFPMRHYFLHAQTHHKACLTSLLNKQGLLTSAMYARCTPRHASLASSALYRAPASSCAAACALSFTALPRQRDPHPEGHFLGRPSSYLPWI